jgi:PAS domain S-box-containing protein
MDFQYSPYAVPLFAAAAITTALAGYALRRWRQAEARIFSLMMIALSWWSLFYGLNIVSATLEAAYLFNRLKYIGVMTVPPLWLILALQYTHHQAFLTRRNLFLLFVPAMLLLPLVLGNPWMRLWWPEVWMDEFAGQAALESTHGWPYYLHIGVSYLYIIAGLALYVQFHRRAGPIYRFQSRLMVLAGAVPLVASALTQLELSPLPWGLDSFFFTLSGVLIAVAIFRYRFLDIMPVARQAIVEQMPDGVIVIDTQGRIVDANPEAQALIGPLEQALVGRSLVDAIQDANLRRALDELTQTDGGAPRNRDVKLSESAGDRVLSIHVTPLSRGEGGLIGRILLLRDITERISVQQELEAMYRQADLERERLALTIRTANDAIVLLDAEGNVLASNPSARALLGDQSIAQFPPPIRKMLGSVETADGVLKAEVEVGEQSFHVAAAPIAGTGVVLTMHDVTHFKHLARMKDEFVATVSHDLRTPLTAILGYAQIAQMDTLSDADRQEMLQRIEQNVDHMTNLISDLLSLAKLEAGVVQKTEPVDLGMQAGEAITILEDVALAKGLTIQRELSAHPPIQADPRLITQMWRNLIDNAIKYTAEGTIKVQVQATEGQVMGRVTDTGVGIPPAALPYVFDKFYRADHPNVQDVSGTGLGLALVKSIVERYGGQIWVESELGVGSTFTVTLPLNGGR